MKFLHSMVRVSNLEESLAFYVDLLGLIETRRSEYPDAKFTLIYLATALGEPEVELTYNWGSTEEYTQGRSFGHLAFEVDNIYVLCEKLKKQGVTINRPPRCGHMAFIKSPDGIAIELLQKGQALTAQEPWLSMENIGSW
jgi:lactoylglutathione lyase